MERMGSEWKLKKIKVGVVEKRWGVAGNRREGEDGR